VIYFVNQRQKWFLEISVKKFPRKNDPGRIPMIFPNSRIKNSVTTSKFAQTFHRICERNDSFAKNHFGVNFWPNFDPNFEKLFSRLLFLLFWVTNFQKSLFVHADFWSRITGRGFCGKFDTKKLFLKNFGHQICKF